MSEAPEALEVLLVGVRASSTFPLANSSAPGTALNTQVARAADIGVATLIESKQPIDFRRQSDASTPREMHRVPLIIHAQPERSRGT